MYILKGFLLLAVFCTSSCIGVVISKKYSNRLQLLKDIKNALNMFEVKINFSCETIPEIFNEISEKVKGTAGKIFKETVENMEKMIAGDAWEKAVENNSQDLKIEDIESLRPLGKLLGKTDVEGQINQISLVSQFIDEQIKIALEEKNANAKMYQKLGAIVGLIMVIVLI